MGDNLLTFTDDNFDAEVLGSTTPTLVDFWADWCAPCKMVAPAVEALAGEYKGKLRVGKLNVDENPKTAARFGIRGIPTLLIFKGGEVAEQVVGVKSKADLKTLIDRTV
ncbi:MAG: thioredoxin [Nitrospinota bacterium]